MADSGREGGGGPWSAPSRPEHDDRWVLGALAAVLLISVGWWALALWPVPGGNPEWLELARAVCFNAGPDGLPDVSGWMMLIGQPLGMFGFLFLVWPRAVTGALARTVRRPAGLAGLAVALLVVVAGLAGAGVRVANAAAARAPVIALPEFMAAAEHPRMDREAPGLGLVNQHGETLELDQLLGVPAFVTFAFGNCHDICPVVVEQARSARDAAFGPGGASLVVITLDPWRDTPARLEALAFRWGLDGPRDHLLSGEVEAVEAVLDAWNVARTRNRATGDVAHPSLSYLLDAEGRIAFATLSGREIMLGLAERLGQEEETRAPHPSDVLP